MRKIYSVIATLHAKLSAYLASSTSSTSDGPKGIIAGRFVHLLLLASVLIPLFVLEFIYSGYGVAAVLLAAAGSVMLASSWFFKFATSAAPARDVFLGSLFCFVVWEQFYFGFYSPGTAWLVVMPVASVLLGSAIAGAVWLVVVVGFLFLFLILVGFDGSQVHIARVEFQHLYTASFAGSIIAMFLFILIVDAARKDAYRKLASAHEEIKDRSERDELTGLLNRRAFYDSVGQMLQEEPAGSVVLLLADLDGFKEVNDTHGHETGDRLLKSIARRFQKVSRTTGAIVARMGGDEFALALSGDDAETRGYDLASEIRRMTVEPLQIGGIATAVGVSIGLTVSDIAASASELMRKTDLAMYEAKRRGKNQVCTYTEDMDCARLQRIELARDLTEAIAAGDIQVHYQPIVDARTLKTTGVEALARWRRQDGSFVPVSDFIAVAEETGLIHRLGLLVLQTACRDWVDHHDLKVSVNISPIQFRNESLIDEILQVLEQTGFPPSRLELEITENCLIENSERAASIVEELRQAGISISLDDFGTGYSSIGYLRQIKFDRIKIDLSLVSGLEFSTSGTKVVQAIAMLAEGLSLALTAEGVENDEQARLLRLIGCTELQGNHFRAAAPAAEIARTMRSASLLA